MDPGADRSEGRLFQNLHRSIVQRRAWKDHHGSGRVIPRPSNIPQRHRETGDSAQGPLVGGGGSSATRTALTHDRAATEGDGCGVFARFRQSASTNRSIRSVSRARVGPSDGRRALTQGRVASGRPGARRPAASFPEGLGGDIWAFPSGDFGPIDVGGGDSVRSVLTEDIRHTPRGTPLVRAVR